LKNQITKISKKRKKERSMVAQKDIIVDCVFLIRIPPLVLFYLKIRGEEKESEILSLFKFTCIKN